MVFRTTSKSLRELNARLKSQGLDFEYIFVGYMPTGKVGYCRNTRHYVARIVKGSNAGATYGDYIEIDFACDENEFGDLSDPKFFPQSPKDALKRRILG